MIKSKSVNDKEKYKNYAKIFNKITKLAETRYYQFTFDTKIHNTKKLWKEINSLCSFNSKRSSDRSNIAKIVANGNVITDPSSMADEFNKYFSNIGSKLACNLQPTTTNFKHFLPPSIMASFYCDNI